MCSLLTFFIDKRGYRLLDKSCYTECQPDDYIAQTRMLIRCGFELPTPPEGRDLLEWSKECVANGTVKMPPQAEAIQRQKAEQSKAMAELPSWFQQAKNLHKHAKQILDYWNQTGKILVTPEQKAERLAICDDCEKLWVNPKTQNKRCSECGCHLAEISGVELGKADFEALTCKNWPDITGG